jgi:8-oxo-dGTP pyrophosphatase MutT (NUDIX family)
MSSGPDYDPADELADEARADIERDEAHEFRPDWCMAPAAILREWMEENGLRAEVLAVACGGRVYKLSALALIEEVLARKPLRQLNADCLARGTSVPARFWLALEHNYRAGLAAGLTDVTSDA